MSLHPYPRGNDPISNKWMPISNVTDNTFDIDVGTTTLGDYEHIFVSASADGLKVQNGQITINVQAITSVGSPTAHTFIGATAGALITGGNYTHTFQSALAGAVRTGTGYINRFVSAEENAITSHGLTQVTNANIPFVYGGYPKANRRIDELMSIVTDTLLDQVRLDQLIILILLDSSQELIQHSLSVLETLKSGLRVLHTIYVTQEIVSLGILLHTTLIVQIHLT